jgi:hypothetical protein
MKTTAFLLLSLAVICVAQHSKPEPSHEVKQLASVTWDLSTHKLTWVVQTGTIANGEFRQAASSSYEISPRDAIMAVQDERRGFSQQEAAAVQQLLNTLSVYCAESVIWWDHGQGEKLGPNGTPEHEKTDRPATPEKEGKKPADIARLIQSTDAAVRSSGPISALAAGAAAQSR